MQAELQFFGAAGEVTGSLHVIRTGHHTVLLECGLVQGGSEADEKNHEPFPVAVDEIDAVVLSHAHIDHSGRIPLLAKRGYRGPVFAQNATRALCAIMLPDSGYLNEKDAEWENKRRLGNGKPRVEPLYTREDAEACLSLFEAKPYDQDFDVVPGIRAKFHDAGHILGSAIVELTLGEGASARTLVFSGDIGYRDAPVMDPPTQLSHADIVIMESTYGDRCHRSFDDTMAELGEIFHEARASEGNILIPAFSVGRSQDLLYLMAENHAAWGLEHWHIFLDSPMAIDATATYARYRHLYGAKLFAPGSQSPNLPNFHETPTTAESMVINDVKSGGIIVAGSGMCTGGRILHHLRNNIWQPGCHVLIVGFQAYGTLGRRLVDGADEIRLFGDTYKVRARVHTVGGLSAHADQSDLLDWYGAFENRPPVYLVHGEPEAQKELARRMHAEFAAPVRVAKPAETVRI